MSLASPPNKPGVHLSQKKLLPKHFLNSLLCPSSASQVMHPCCAPHSDVPAQGGKPVRDLCLDISSEKISVLGQSRAFHETWALLGESWMEKMNNAWWRDHAKPSLATGQQQIQSGPQRALHRGIFWAEEKSSWLAAVNKRVESRVRRWEAIDEGIKWLGTGWKSEKQSSSGWVWGKASSNWYSIHKDWSNDCNKQCSEDKASCQSSSVSQGQHIQQQMGKQRRGFFTQGTV